MRRPEDKVTTHQVEATEVYPAAILPLRSLIESSHLSRRSPKWFRYAFRCAFGIGGRPGACCGPGREGTVRACAVGAGGAGGLVGGGLRKARALGGFRIAMSFW